MSKLPNELQRLQNLISGARNEPNYSEMTLRRIIKETADDAPTGDIIRIAEAILKCGIDSHQSRWAGRN